MLINRCVEEHLKETRRLDISIWIFLLVFIALKYFLSSFKTIKCI